MASHQKTLLSSLVVILGGYNFYTISKTNTEVESILADQLFQLIAQEKLAINMAQRSDTARGYLYFVYRGKFRNRRRISSRNHR